MLIYLKNTGIMAGRSDSFNQYRTKFEIDTMIMDETFSCVRQIENRMKNLYQQYNILSRSTNELRHLKETLKSSSDEPKKAAVPQKQEVPKFRMPGGKDIQISTKNARLYARRLSQLLVELRKKTGKPVQQTTNSE